MSKYIKTSTVSTVPEINSELEKIQTSINTLLSRDGDIPNQMEATLDMNSNKIINLPQPASQTEPVRLQDLNDALNTNIDYFSFPTADGFIQNSAITVNETYVAFAGFYTEGDGGEGVWVREGTTGLTPSQYPADLEAAELVDSLGAKWKLARRNGINVKQLGAKGDGVADDTAAIQAAVTELDGTGGLIYFPAGTYIMSNPGIYLSDNTRYVGEGKEATILKKKNNVGATDELDPIFREQFDGTTYYSVDNVSVENMTFEGNGLTGIQTNKGAGLLRMYACTNLRVINCMFRYGRSYGVGLQGQDRSSDPTRRGPQEDIYFENCDFFANGKESYLLGTDFDDGLDIKSSLRCNMVGCRSWDNGGKGFDFRGRQVTASNCHAWQNNGAGFSFNQEGLQDPPGSPTIEPVEITLVNCHSNDNVGNGFAIVPQIRVGVTTAPQYVSFTNCVAEGNLHNFALTDNGTLSYTQSYISIVNCISKDPSTTTRHFLGSGVAESIGFTGCIFTGGDDFGMTFNVLQEGPITITGCHFENIAQTAINLPNSPVCPATIVGNSFRDLGTAAVAGQSLVTAVGNTFDNLGATIPINVTAQDNFILDKAQGRRNVAAASTITLESYTDTWNITGTGTVDTITAGWDGREVTLRFDGAGVTLSDGTGNLVLAGNLVGTSNDVIKLISDGTNWYEISRSVN